MTLFEHAQRYVGEVQERPKNLDHPFILWCLESTPLAVELHDEIPWCSAFVNRLAWDLRLPRSKRANALSWLEIGIPIGLEEAVPAWDVVVFRRGKDPASGHVGVFAGLEGERVRVVGGNQSNGVTVASYPRADVLGVRRLKAAA